MNKRKPFDRRAFVATAIKDEVKRSVTPEIIDWFMAAGEMYRAQPTAAEIRKVVRDFFTGMWGGLLGTPEVQTAMAHMRAATRIMGAAQERRRP